MTDWRNEPVAEVLAELGRRGYPDIKVDDKEEPGDIGRLFWAITKRRETPGIQRLPARAMSEDSRWCASESMTRLYRHGETAVEALGRLLLAIMDEDGET